MGWGSFGLRQIDEQVNHFLHLSWLAQKNKPVEPVSRPEYMELHTHLDTLQLNRFDLIPGHRPDHKDANRIECSS